MRVLALISGGKDSTYSMMKCIAHGHEVVALGNLHPPARETEEMDSFMYQTVGHAHINAIAEAMELPLFRREIRGAAVEQEMQYACTEGDEVEDLLELLAEVKRKMPEVEAVCSGAVLSNYQRVRVEEVCGRLSLTSLAFLWQRGQRELLNEMISAGVVAIVVKTASMGLKPAHLGRTIGELAPVFERLNEQFGFHECGEGGEYETCTLDCPLFKRHIEVVGSSVVRHSSDVSLLSISEVVLRSKDGTEEQEPEPVPVSDAADLAEATAAEVTEAALAAVGTAEPAWERC